MTVAQATSIYPFVVAEEQHGDHQATEALFLTFNVDLGFFEARLLGRLRATGARVTILADAGVWEPDTRAVRHAGRAYHLGLVDTPSAFHPKLMVVAGEKRAIAAVGSANLTMGGWQYNRELLTVFNGDQHQMPVAFRDIRDALLTLRDREPLDHVTDLAFGRVAETLSVLLAGAEPVDTDHRIHASWDGPLIDCLPQDPVEEVLLSAAFHDPASEAVRRVIARLQPKRVQVAIQPGWTHLDPAALDGILSGFKPDVDVVVLRDPESPGADAARYRHGKLIEWVTTGGERWALTGSPNLSIVALCREVAGRGNHELAVIGRVSDSLFPGGEPVDLDDVPILLPEPVSGQAQEGAQNVRIMSALRAGERLRVQLNRPATLEITVEVSPLVASPDDWTPVGTLPPGAAVSFLDTSVTGGSRVRATWLEPTYGLRRSPPIYVTDGERVRMRAIPERKTSRTHRSSAADLFGDDLALLDVLQGDLASFALDVTNSRRPTLTRDDEQDRATHERERAPDEPEPWLWLQEDTVRKYGPSLASWLLALPRLQAEDGADMPWLDKLSDEAEAALDSDEAADQPDIETLEAAETDTTASGQIVDHTQEAEQRQAARRRWARRAAAVADGLSLPSRLLILRVTVAFWAAGNWPDEDLEPFRLTRHLLSKLDTGHQPPELQERAASVAAVGLTVMRQRTDLSTGNEQAHHYGEARAIVAPLLGFATEDTIDHYVSGLRTINGGALTTGHVTDTIDDLLSGDALADLQGVMEERGYQVHRPAPNLMHVVVAGGNPELIAAEAVGIAQDYSDVAVWVTNERSLWACAAWSEPDLVTVHRFGTRSRWRHQRLRNVSPATAAAMLREARLMETGTDGLPDVVNRPKHAPTADALSLLTRVGVLDPSSPPCCAPPEAV